MLDLSPPELAAMRSLIIDSPTVRFQTPADVGRMIDPRTVQTPALDLIDDELARCLDVPDSRLIVCMPPQEGKSTRVSRDYPVWALQRRPDLRIVTASYAQSLATRNGRAVRNALQANPQLGLTVSRDTASASEWTLDTVDAQRGGLLAVGRGAGVTGRPADLLIIDDPLKDRREADSLTIRDGVWDWWTDALAARLSPGASVVLVLTRWHHDDLAGRLLDRDAAAGWELLNIPAQADSDDDPLGREPGQFMLSARGRTEAQWEQRKATAGPRTWASLYQGRPTPGEGNRFPRTCWQLYDTLPDLSGAAWCQSWDLAFKAGASSDYVVGQVWAKLGADFYLVDQTRGRLSFTETCAELVRMSELYPQATAKLVEDKANGPAVMDSLRHTVSGLVPVNPQGGKESRASAIEPFVAAGNVHLPRNANFLGELVEEAAAFPQGSHDDQVDAMSQALTYLGVTITPDHSNYVTSW